MKKIHAFGLLAAALIVAPSTAFAGQDGSNVQILNQNNTVSGYNNSSSQRGQQYSTQNQSSSGRYKKTGRQRADNLQIINQDAGVYGVGNQSRQEAIQRNVQRQIDAAKYRR
ncbi:hypothetical protein [Iningainema tapete]|uniref:Uncharacterized protein n=1 Tax=Iningainema tapete BLCC-T55 TaxID=2748662 RepID=A0A8J6XIQ8_9CYAN|nr:hypothetical protein [Iningainema tapete]MBD2773141.1 hypothetical protein [Iningainema tapete BLCC-T55]